MENETHYNESTFEKLINSIVPKGDPLSWDTFDLQMPTANTYAIVHWTIGQFRTSLGKAGLQLEKIVEKLPDGKTKLIMSLEKSKSNPENFNLILKCVQTPFVQPIVFWVRISGFDLNQRAVFLKGK